MKQIALAIIAVGFTALGMWGYQTDIVGAGCLVAIGVLAALDML